MGEEVEEEEEDVDAEIVLVVTGLDADVEAELLEELLELGELVVAEGDVFPKVVKMLPYETKYGKKGVD